MPVKKDRAIEAKPALATATTGLRWMNVAVTSTWRASIKRTTAIRTWRINAGEPPVKTTANGFGSVEEEKVMNRLANMPSRNWTINRGIINRDNSWICPGLMGEEERVSSS